MIRTKYLVTIGSLLLVATGAFSASPQVTDDPFVWRMPRDNAGGNCTQFAIHPLDPDVRYVASGDIGGYRWDADNNRWVNMTDWNAGQFGGYLGGLAIDPTDPAVVYYAAGKGPGDIYKSTDGGVTFTASQVRNADDRPVFVSGGEDPSTSGELIVVDPNNPNVLFFASRRDGLFRTDQASQPGSWQKVETFTARGDVVRTNDADGKPTRQLITRGGLTLVAIDPHGGTVRVDGHDVSRTIYVGVGGERRAQESAGAEIDLESESGIWRSNDGGQTWQRLGGPREADNVPHRGYVDADGNFWVTISGRVCKVVAGSDEVVDLNAPQGPRGFFAIALDPRDADHAVVNRYGVARRESSYDDSNRLFRTTDGGETWTELDVTFESPGWWWWFLSPTHWMTFDPHGQTDADGRTVTFWAGDWLGPWTTPDITIERPHFVNVGYGRGGSYVVDIVTPPALDGHAIAPVFMRAADWCGFRYLSLTSVPTRRLTQTAGRNDGLGDGTSTGFCESDPRFMAAVGGWQHGTHGGGGTSTDNGKTWRGFESKGLAHPGYGRDPKLGRIAVGSTVQENGYPLLVWVPRFQIPRYSTDFGQTWTVSTGAPRGMTPSEWDPWKTLAADPVEGQTFYALDNNNAKDAGEARVYRSADGGATWQHVGGIKGSWRQRQWAHHNLVAMPGVQGDLWITLHDPFTRPDQEPARGLFRSTDGGETWNKVVPELTPAHAVAFGHPAPGRDNPVLMVTGTIGDKRGIFVSDDATALSGDLADATWRRIWDHQTNEMTSLVHAMHSIAADRQVYGRYYAGTTGTGRGMFYGVSAGAHESAPSAPTPVEAVAELDHVRVAWNDPIGATSYDLFRSDASGERGEKIASDLGESSFRNHPDADAVYYTVVARNDAGESSPSTPVGIRPYRQIEIASRFGTPGLNNETYDLATDGDPRTSFDAASPSGGYAGFSSDEPVVVSRIRFFPRGWDHDRMAGGRFQGADSESGPWTDLYVIPRGVTSRAWTDVRVASDTPFTHFRYVAAEGTHTTIGEMTFYTGGDRPRD